MRQIYEHHPRIGFRFIPGVKARIAHEGGGYLVRANSTGFRDDREFVPASAPGVRRVLVFGDSFTAGEGVSNGKRWTDAVERAVPGLELLNFGMPATGTDQHFLIYEEFARGLEHTLVVIAVFVENIRRVASRYRWFTDAEGRRVLYAKPWFELRGGELVLRGTPVPSTPVELDRLTAEERATIAATARFPALKAAFRRLRASPVFERVVVDTGLKDRALRLAGYQPLPEYEEEGGDAWRVMREVIRRWIAASARPVALVPIPLYHHVEGLASAATYQGRLREAAEGAGAAYVDPLPILAAAPQERRRGFYYPGDGHLTAEGHEALGRAVAPAIASLAGAASPGGRT